MNNDVKEINDGTLINSVLTLNTIKLREELLNYKKTKFLTNNMKLILFRIQLNRNNYPSNEDSTKEATQVS